MRVNRDKLWEESGKWSSFVNGSWKYTVSFLSFFSTRYSPCLGDIEKEVLGQGMIALAFSDASSPSSWYHLLYSLRRQDSSCSGPSTLWALPPATFPPHSELSSNCPPKQSMHLQALCKLFSLLRQLFSILFYESPTYPLAQTSLDLKYPLLSLWASVPCVFP